MASLLCTLYLIQRRMDAKSDLIEFTQTILFSYEKSLAQIFLCLYVLTRRRAAHVSPASYYTQLTLEIVIGSKYVI